ncbi:MAG: hypothetical protein M0R68_07925 [Bacteroidetes bacterium]|nr:hypothetical protein [Bacteroidota bacterium]
MSKINHKREKLIPPFLVPTWYKDLVGTRKEAKEPLAKCNARDESRSHLPVDGKIAIKKSLHDFSPHSLRVLFWIAMM